jgi:hypothetical protein
MEKSVLSKSENIKRLYSYRRLMEDGYELGNIKKNIAYFGDVQNFNDPIEGMIFKQKLVFDFSPFNPELVIEAGKKLYEEVNHNWLIPSWFIEDMKHSLFQKSPWEVYCKLNELAKRVEGYRNKLRVLCLTPHGNNTLMWAHYANSHKGICIEYEIDYSNLPDCISSVPVNYTNEFKLYNCSEFILHPYEILSRMLITKHLDWSYEHEWRAILKNGNNTMQLNNKFRMVSVTAGVNCEERDKVKGLCKLRGLKYYEVYDSGIDGLVRKEKI